jgi:cell division protein FtsB
VAETDEFEAEWRSARPSKLPWILLGVSLLVLAFTAFTLSGQKDDAEKQLRAARDQGDLMQKKNLELLQQKSTLEKRVSDLERENKLLAERKVEPVKPPAVDPKKAPAKPAKKKKNAS